jgi:hypothetical protein
MSIGLVSKTSKFGYVPGSLYKRFQQTGLFKPGSNMQKLNRQAATGYASAVASSGALMFDAGVVESQGKSELTAKQVLARVQADVNAQRASMLNLGAFASKSV